MTPESTACVQTDREKQKEHLLEAALMWIYDQSCASALADFEAAAEAYTGKSITGFWEAP